ncbi:hypothetical protein S7711_06126 [Stachybotrys chartarum IBT 7711]|uniref:Protein kinase domain-containing protein n=1 Tax=Stachybotrys chartarum (strain CBS 109288 / IBT 7711) TaxID=1280523 RepID=A0A084B674_STACB|nr:hypothetical protein S7711_06126 [Stachybotrys chartarum IBT 7711]KFA56509.1 hypothetical protein S40293_01153 [Stachybotrys chartarum IBT 40293]
MALDSYSSLCNDIYHDISRKMKRQDDAAYKFAPKGLVGKVLNDLVLRQLYRSLLTRVPNGPEPPSITEDKFIDRVEKRKLREFIAVLVFATCPRKAMALFITQLVAPNAWPLESPHGTPLGALPASRRDLDFLFQEAVTVDKFFNHQIYFCTVVILRGTETKVCHPALQRLPYIEKPREIGRGSFGIVYKVRVAKRHLFDPSDAWENTDTEDLARKDYVMKTERPWMERDILDTVLNNSAGGCKNILQSLGSIQIENTYSLFMELADHDLDDYMTNLHTLAPNTLQKAELIRCAAGLASGLDFLHTKLRSRDNAELVCYHMDLKPSNILISRDAARDENSQIWKLSDFGMARVKIKRSTHNIESEGDFNRLFNPQDPPSNPTASATLNKRAAGTYLAPESVSSTPKMKASSDIWSLGCIISVLFVYLDSGKKNLDPYSDERANRSQSEGCGDCDRFFLYSRQITSIRRHPVVSEWHKKLVKNARETDKAEAEIIRTLLSYVEKSVLQIEQNMRATAEQVQKVLERTYNLYRNLEKQRGAELQQDNNAALARPTPFWERLRPKYGAHRHYFILSHTEIYLVSRII